MDPTTAPPARTLPFQAVANRIVRGLLRTPLLARAAGSRLITIYVVGRRSGRCYSVPVTYTRHDGQLLVGTSFPWVRNLRSGEPVEIRLGGRRRTADVVVVTDEAAVVAGYATIVRGNHAFARFNGIHLDAAGEPDPADLRRNWAGGARLVRLAPR